MKDEEIELNTAILAWEKGFPKKLGKITQSLLQRWLRETHNIIITIEHWTNQPVNNQIWENCYDYNFQQLHHGTTPHKTYEQALEKGLYEALKLI